MTPPSGRTGELDCVHDATDNARFSPPPGCEAHENGFLERNHCRGHSSCCPEPHITPSFFDCVQAGIVKSRRENSFACFRSRVPVVLVQSAHRGPVSQFTRNRDHPQECRAEAGTSIRSRRARMVCGMAGERTAPSTGEARPSLDSVRAGLRELDRAAWLTLGKGRSIRRDARPSASVVQRSGATRLRPAMAAAIQTVGTAFRNGTTRTQCRPPRGPERRAPRHRSGESRDPGSDRSGACGRPPAGAAAWR